MSLNKVQLIGNVGIEPEVQTIGLGIKKARFSLATNELVRRDDREAETKPVWHNIECWESLAKYVERNVKKGDQIYLEGKICYRTYTSNNIERTYTYINASQIIMLKKKIETTEEAQ